MDHPSRSSPGQGEWMGELGRGLGRRIGVRCLRHSRGGRSRSRDGRCPGHRGQLHGPDVYQSLDGFLLRVEQDLHHVGLQGRDIPHRRHDLHVWQVLRRCRAHCDRRDDRPGRCDLERFCHRFLHTCRYGLVPHSRRRLRRHGRQGPLWRIVGCRHGTRLEHLRQRRWRSCRRRMDHAA